MRSISISIYFCFVLPTFEMQVTLCGYVTQTSPVSAIPVIYSYRSLIFCILNWTLFFFQILRTWIVFCQISQKWEERMKSLPRHSAGQAEPGWSKNNLLLPYNYWTVATLLFSTFFLNNRKRLHAQCSFVPFFVSTLTVSVGSKLWMHLH